MDYTSYNPCYTCRRRRIQCDQSSVPCGKCRKAGLECLDKRPIRWVKGVAIRGKMQGRSFESVDTSAIGGLESTKLRETLMKSSSAGHLGRFRSHDTSLGLLSVLQDPNLSNLDRISRYYLDYFSERICKLFIVYDSGRNPFRNLIPLGFEDPVLLKVLLALAARHHANTGRFFSQSETPRSMQIVEANRNALSFKYQAIGALSHSFQDSNLPMQDTTVACVFLLIFLDLLESGSDGWTFHLEGAKHLIASIYPQSNSHGISQGPGDTVQEIRRFITKQIYSIETLGAIFLRPKLSSQFATFYLPELQLQETIEKSFLGCPEYILTAIECLTMKRNSISGQQPLNHIAIYSHSTDVSSLLELIQNFDCSAWASNLQQSRNCTLQETINLCTLSRSYKIGALIYGRRILDVLTGEVTVQDDMTTELLVLVDSLKDYPALFKCVLWPIFVAGLESERKSQRDFVVSCMERFWYITKCLNAVNAARALQNYWHQQDSPGQTQSQWIFNIGHVDRDWLWI